MSHDFANDLRRPQHVWWYGLGTAGADHASSATPALLEDVKLSSNQLAAISVEQ